MVKFTVIGGDSSSDLAKKIARRLNAAYVKTENREFPDGESKIIVKNIPKNSIILVVQSTYPPVDTNLLHLLSIISKARKYSSKIYAVIPYMGYARQDREFLDGEIISISVIGKLLKSVGTKKIITVDIHSKMALGQLKIISENVTAISELARFFKKKKLSNALVISPDLGGKERAEEFAKQMNTDCIALKKNRSRKTGKVDILTKSINVRNRDLILVDDMISTGGSIIKATQFLKKQKCKRVYVACTHALLVNGAQQKIKKAGVAEIISTNTIPGNTSKVDISEIIAKKIK